MWWLYLFCTVLAFGIGICCGIGFEKLGQYLYFKRVPSDGGKIFIKANNELIEKNIDVDTVFLGDSITIGYDLDKYFPNKNYINRGISGDITIGVLERLESNVLVIKPRRIVILIGTNDIGMKYPEDIIIDNYKKILNNIKSALPQTEIFVQQIYRVNEDIMTDTNRKNKVINSVNSKIKALCAELGATCINPNKVLVAENEMLCPSFTGDGLHLNKHGYVQLTKFLKDTIPNL